MNLEAMSCTVSVAHPKPCLGLGLPPYGGQSEEKDVCCPSTPYLWSLLEAAPGVARVALDLLLFPLSSSHHTSVLFLLVLFLSVSIFIFSRKSVRGKGKGQKRKRKKSRFKSWSVYVGAAAA